MGHPSKNQKKEIPALEAVLCLYFRASSSTSWDLFEEKWCFLTLDSPILGPSGSVKKGDFPEQNGGEIPKR